MQQAKRMKGAAEAVVELICVESSENCGPSRPSGGISMTSWASAPRACVSGHARRLLRRRQRRPKRRPRRRRRLTVEVLCLVVRGLDLRCRIHGEAAAARGACVADRTALNEHPRCERCWRHMPHVAADAGSEDGWVYRGHPGCVAGTPGCWLLRKKMVVVRRRSSRDLT